MCNITVCWYLLKGVLFCLDLSLCISYYFKSYHLTYLNVLNNNLHVLRPEPPMSLNINYILSRIYVL